MTDRIPRQAMVPDGVEVLPNDNGTAPGLYLRANINPAVASPHIFVLPGPPRELASMFRNYALPILRRLAPQRSDLECKTFRLARIGESQVERAVGEELLKLDKIELGYCARPAEVDVRVIGSAAVVAQAEAILRRHLGDS